MATPTKAEILARAQELYAKDNWQLFETNPETQELAEENYLNRAKEQLMSSEAKDYEQLWKSYSEQPQPFQFDLKLGLERGTVVCGGRGSGKSNTAKVIAESFQKHGCILRIYDNSQAWRRSSVPNLVAVKPVDTFSLDYEQSYVFDLSYLDLDQQKRFVETQIREDFNKTVAIPETKRNWRVHVLEECELLFGRERNKTVLQLIACGRNYKMSYLAISQRLAMLHPDLISLSGQIFVGYTHEQNDLKKLKNWLQSRTSELKTLKLGEFLRYCDGETLKMQVPKFVHNAEKVNVQPTTPKAIEPLLNTKQPSRQNSYAIMKLAFVSGLGLLFLLSAIGAF